MNVEKIPCYIMDMNTSAKVSFDVEIPDSVNDSYTASFSDQVTQGRSSPFKVYSNSGPRQVSFTVVIALDYRRDLNDVVKSLRAMLKPYKGKVITPPKVKVRIGDFINIKAVPLAFDVTWKGGYKDNMFRICECSFSFAEVEDVSSFDDSKSSSSASTSGNNTKTSATTTSKVIVYEVGQTYVLTRNTKAYYTSAEALEGKAKDGHPVATAKKGTYFIYNKAKGMINITKTPGVKGVGWIKP